MERFGDIVVRPDLQPDDTVNHIILPRDHDDGNGRGLANLARKIQSIVLTEMNIKRDQRERMVSQRLNDLRRGRGFEDVKALGFKYIAKKRANLCIIFDNQDLMALHTKLLWP